MNTDIDLRNCLLSNFCNLIPVYLDGSNYVTWKFLLETMLRGCGLMKYIDGSFPCPSQYMITEEVGDLSEMTAEYLTWKQNDSAIMSILASTLSSDALCFIIGSKSSKEIWCRLKEKYVDDSRYNIMNLKNSLYNIQKGSNSIDRYLLRVKSICDQLAMMGVYMADEDIVFSVLHGLPSEFATITAVIRIKTLSSSVSMKELRSLLLIAEDEIEQTVKSISAPASLPLSPLVAMVAQNNLVNSSQKMQYGISDAGTPSNAFFPCPYVGNCSVSSTSLATAPNIGLMPSFSISNGAPQSMSNSRYVMSNGAFNGTRQLQSQVHNLAYGDGYFQQNGGFSQQQSSGGLQQNSALQSIGNLSYSGSKSQGPAQHNVNFSTGYSKSKGGLSQHNVSSCHKSRNSNSGDGFYMHIPPIHVPPEEPVAQVSTFVATAENKVDNTEGNQSLHTDKWIKSHNVKEAENANVLVPSVPNGIHVVTSSDSWKQFDDKENDVKHSTFNENLNQTSGEIGALADAVMSQITKTYMVGFSKVHEPNDKSNKSLHVNFAASDAGIDDQTTHSIGSSSTVECQAKAAFPCTPRERPLLNCRQACLPVEPWPSLPLIHPG